MSAFLKQSCKIAIAGSLAIAFSNETEQNISRGFSANAVLINMKTNRRKVRKKKHTWCSANPKPKQRKSEPQSEPQERPSHFQAWTCDPREDEDKTHGSKPQSISRKKKTTPIIACCGGRRCKIGEPIETSADQSKDTFFDGSGGKVCERGMAVDNSDGMRAQVTDKKVTQVDSNLHETESEDSSSGEESGASSPATKPSPPSYSRDAEDKLGLRFGIDGVVDPDISNETEAEKVTIITTMHTLLNIIPVFCSKVSHHGIGVKFENGRVEGDVRLGDVVEFDMGDDGGFESLVKSVNEKLGIRENPTEVNFFNDIAFVVHGVNRNRTKLVLKTLFHDKERESKLGFKKSRENLYTFEAIVDPNTHKVTSLRNENEKNLVLEGVHLPLRVLPGIMKAYGAPCESDVPNSEFIYEVVNMFDPTHGVGIIRGQSKDDVHKIQLNSVGVRAVYEFVRQNPKRAAYTQSEYKLRKHNCHDYAKDVRKRLIEFNATHKVNWARLQPKLTEKWFELSNESEEPLESSEEEENGEEEVTSLKSVEHAFNREFFLNNESTGSLRTQLSFVIYHFLRFADLVNTESGMTPTQYMRKTFDENWFWIENDKDCVVLTAKLDALYSAVENPNEEFKINKTQRLAYLTAPIKNGDDKLSFINFHLVEFKKSVSGECQDNFFDNLFSQYEGLCFTKRDFEKLVENRRTLVSADDIVLEF